MSPSLTFEAPTCYVAESRLIIITYRRRQFQQHCSEASMVCSGRLHQQIRDSKMRMIVRGFEDFACVPTLPFLLMRLAKTQSLHKVNAAAQAAVVSRAAN